jgi:hypothetical protein
MVVGSSATEVHGDWQMRVYAAHGTYIGEASPNESVRRIASRLSAFLYFVINKHVRLLDYDKFVSTASY